MLHVAVLPLVVVVLLGVHFWRIRKDGGLSRPPDDEQSADADIGETVDDSQTERFPASKTYGLMTLVKKSNIRSADVDLDKTVSTWPHLMVREVILFVLIVIGIWAPSTVFPAPPEEPANPVSPPNPAKAPWYFLGLQELVSYSAFLGGVVIPGLMVGALIALPYIDKNPSGIGVWFHKARKLALTVFSLVVLVNVILIIVGTFFRGPNWFFYLPWEMPVGEGH